LFLCGGSWSPLYSRFFQYAGQRCPCATASIWTAACFSRYTMANGNRLRTIFRVVCSPAGHRAGDSIISPMARSTSAANLTAAASFRCKYQLSPDFNSASAEGWISSGLATIEDSCDLPPSLRPGNGFHLTGLQFLNTASNLLAPRLFGGRVHGILQALQKRACKRGPRLGWQC